MAEFQNWNLGREFQAGLERGQQTRRQDQFRALAGQAINAPQQERDFLVQQAIANDPESGFALQKQLEADTDRRQSALFNMARGFKQIHSQNPGAAAAFYSQQLVPGLKRLGFPVSDQYNEQEVLPVVEQVLAIYDPTLASGVPTGFREADLKARAAGYQPGTPEYQQFFRVGGGIEGRAPSGGFGFEVVPGVGLTRRNPRSGVVEVYDEASGNFAPIGTGGQLNQGQPAPAPVPAPPQSPIVKNLQGVSGRYSIGADGQPVFIAEDVAPNVAQGIESNPAAFQGAQVTAPPEVRPMPAAVQRFGEVTTRTPEQQAYLTEQEKERARLDAYTRATDLEVDREAAKTTAKATAEAESKRDQAVQGKAADARRAIPLIQEALTILPRATGSTLGERRDAAGRLIGVTTEGAKAAARLDILGPQLVGLVPRFEGPQSDADRKLYEAAAGDLNNRNKTVGERQEAAKQMLRLHNKAIQQAAPKAASEDDALINKYLRP